MDRDQLQRAVAESNRAPFGLHDATWDAVHTLFWDNEDAVRFAPEGDYAIDPRDSTVTLFNEKRARRPKDYTEGAKTPPPPCPICAGRTTPIIDIRQQSDGFCFVNRNLYPMVMPGRAPAAEKAAAGGTPGRSSSTGNPTGEATGDANGLHLLHWTSSFHDTDWPELSADDRLLAMTQIADTERTLLRLAGDGAIDEGYFVSIIKNVGKSVGGSLSHGHQQIALTNVAPKRVQDNRRFFSRFGTTFSAFLQEDTPAELTVARIDGGTLVVPRFMRRPYDMIFTLDDTQPQHIHQASTTDLRALAEGLAVAMVALRGILTALHREIAYNVVFHTGPGAGIYLEFLPWTQENGGYEQLGLSSCQGIPARAADELRSMI